MNSSSYTWLMLAGIFVTLFTWSRIAKRDQRLLFIYVGALLGAFVGAKIIYLLAEGWLHFGKPDMWLQLATGKSILGALLGGYGGVEIAKKMVGYSGVTGDWFAWIAPIGIIFGRVGCLLHGCCLGKVCAPSWFTLADPTGASRWPAVPAEILFNVIALIVFYYLRQRHVLTGQHFHLYLIAYGLFRFFHEFLRETPQIAGPFSGYHAAALALVFLGCLGFLHRLREEPRAEVSSQP